MLPLRNQAFLQSNLKDANNFPGHVMCLLFVNQFFMELLDQNYGCIVDSLWISDLHAGLRIKLLLGFYKSANLCSNSE